MVMGHDVSKKKMFILMNSRSRMCAGIFELKFQLINKTADVVMVEKEEEEDDDIILEPIGTFFNQRPPAGPAIASVAGCVVGHELYLFPDEREQNCEEWFEDYPPPPIPNRIPPCKFHLFQNKTQHYFNLPNSPLARKILPLVVAVSDQIYALSFVDYCNRNSFRGPCFELLDTKSYEWTPLPCSPVHKEFYRLSGHVVLDDSFILVCLKRRITWEVFFYSYNVQTGKWKTVNIPKQQGLYGCVINKEAVVIGNDIYTYDFRHLEGFLKVFSYTDVSDNNNNNDEEEEEVDLLLGSVRVVEGLEFDRKYPEDYFDDFDTDNYFRCPDTSALAKVEDRILCVIHSLYQDCDRVMHFCVSVIQIEYEGDRCTTLKSFMCHLHVGRVLSNPIIKSCFVLDSNETSDQSGEASSFAG